MLVGSQGTLIRVFSMPLGELVYTFRRGNRAAAIHCLSFSHDERFLVAAGSNPTIHVYKLEKSAAAVAGKRAFPASRAAGTACGRLPIALTWRRLTAGDRCLVTHPQPLWRRRR